MLVLLHAAVRANTGPGAGGGFVFYLASGGHGVVALVSSLRSAGGETLIRQGLAMLVRDPAVITGRVS